jgi:hypothetical protein
MPVPIVVGGQGRVNRGKMGIVNRPANPRRMWPVIAAMAAIAAGFTFVFTSTGGQATSTTMVPPPTGIADPAAPTLPPEEPAADVTEPTPLPAVPPGWTSLPPGPLAPRVGQAAAWTGKELLVWGGRTMGGEVSDAAGYSPPQDQWRPLPASPIAGDVDGALAWAGGELVAFTGDVATFQPDQNEWTVPSDLPAAAPRPLAATAANDDVILIGSDDGRGLFAVAVTHEDGCCRHLADPPIGFDHGRALWSGSRVLLIGGEAAQGSPGAEPRFAGYDPETGTWTVLEPPPLDGSPGLTAAWTGDRLLAVDFALAAATWDAERGWRRMPGAPLEFQGCFPRIVMAGDIVFAWYCRQAAVFDPGSEQWTRIATPELDPHAVSTSCVPVAAHESVLMWCGNDPAEPFFWAVEPSQVPPAAEWGRQPAPLDS